MRITSSRTTATGLKCIARQTTEPLAVRALSEVLSKPADQSLEEAIRESFVTPLEPEARASCEVRNSTEGPPPGRDKIIVEIVPTGRYEKKIMHDLERNGPRDFGCGPFGKGQGTTYFEYHPFEDRTKYLYVIYGMDAPLFDENTIALYPIIGNINAKLPASKPNVASVQPDTPPKNDMAPWMAQLFEKQPDADALKKSFFVLPLKGIGGQEHLSHYEANTPYVLMEVRKSPAWKEAGGEKQLSDYQNAQEFEAIHRRERVQSKEAEHAALEHEVMNNTQDCRDMLDVGKSLKDIDKSQKEAVDEIKRGSVDEETCSKLSDAERRLTKYMNMQVSCFKAMKETISYLRLPRNSDNLDLIVNITKGSIDQIHNAGRGQCWRN